MVQAVPRPLTVHDFMDLPEGPPFYQLVEGDFFMSSPPSGFHQDIAGNVFFILKNYLREHSIGKVGISPYGVYLTDINAYLPDVFYVSRKRRALFSKRGVEGAPDLVVEILSPSTAHLDKGSKRIIYSRVGVVELWLIDPELKEIHVFHLRKDPDAPVAVYGEEEIFSSPLFPGLKFSGAEIFAV